MIKRTVKTRGKHASKKSENKENTPTDISSQGIILIRWTYVAFWCKGPSIKDCCVDVIRPTQNILSGIKKKKHSHITVTKR